MLKKSISLGIIALLAIIISASIGGNGCLWTGEQDKQSGSSVQTAVSPAATGMLVQPSLLFRPTRPLTFS